jgi:hypothetical protein
MPRRMVESCPLFPPTAGLPKMLALFRMPSACKKIEAPRKPGRLMASVDASCESSGG